MSKKIELSIVIPTLDEEKSIGQTIHSALGQAFKKDAIEIILVDAGSKDNTIARASAANQVIVNDTYKGKKFMSLNAGAKAASGDILLFLDADTLLPRHYDLGDACAQQKGKYRRGFSPELRKEKFSPAPTSVIKQVQVYVDQTFLWRPGHICR